MTLDKKINQLVKTHWDKVQVGAKKENYADELIRNVSPDLHNSEEFKFGYELLKDISSDPCTRQQWAEILSSKLLWDVVVKQGNSDSPGELLKKLKKQLQRIGYKVNRDVNVHLLKLTKQISRDQQKRIKWIQLVEKASQDLNQFVQENEEDCRNLYLNINQIVFPQKKVPDIEPKAILIALGAELPENVLYKSLLKKTSCRADITQAKSLLHDLVKLVAREKMEKYWMITPSTSKKQLTTAWEYDKKHGTIAIGWGTDSPNLQDLSPFADIQKFETEVKNGKLGWQKNVQEEIWNFHRTIRKGDIVIAREGEEKILGIGIVKKTAYYDSDKGVKRVGGSSPESDITPRFIEVFWTITGSFSEKLKTDRNIQEISHTDYQNILPKIEEGILEELRRRETIRTETEAVNREYQLERDRIRVQQPELRGSQEPNYYIGIDLGMANCVMAWGAVNPRTNQLEPKIVPINMRTAHYAMQKKDLLPSYVYFENGQPPSVGEYAKKMLEEQPDRVVKSIKHQIGTQNRFDIDGIFYTPTQILALILKHLAASAKSHFGFIPDNAVITVPAYFNTKMRAATIEAANLAGFRTTTDNGKPCNILLDEPYAVLYDRINQEIRGEVEAMLISSRDSKLVLIFDLGGGALEVSLHRVSYQENQDMPEIEPIARSYNIQISGNSFDRRLSEHFRNTYYENKIKQSSKNFQLYQFENILQQEVENIFQQYAEQAKIDLSKQIEVQKKLDPLYKPTETFAIPTIIRKPFWDEVFRYETFTLGEYEKIMKDLLACDLTWEAINQFTKALPKHNIIYPIIDVFRKGKNRMGGELRKPDVVLLNGGMTKLHTIRQRLETYFGSTPLEVNSDGSVARGAVVFHYNSAQRSLKLPRILQERINIKIIAQEPPGRQVIFEAGDHFPITKSFNLSAEIGATSAQLVISRSAPDNSEHFPPQSREIQFSRGLKKDDIPISILMSINEKEELNVEGHPKNNPDEKLFMIMTNLGALWQENFVQHKFDRLEQLNIDNEITELTTNFKQLVLTNNLHIQRQVLDRIETQGSRIVQSANAVEFIAPLCDIVNSLNNFGKMLAISLLGNLAEICSDIDLLHNIYEVSQKLISREKIKTNKQSYVNSVVQHAVETIGKTELPIGKSYLFNLLHLDETSTIRSTIIYAIGVEHLILFIERSEDTNRIATNNWALGKIGSREMENPVSIEKLTPFIANFMKQLETDCHEDIKQNSIYALAEICDLRRDTNDPVEPKTAAEVILLLFTFLTDYVHAKLSNLTTFYCHDKLQETAILAIQMVRGVDLSSDEEDRLRSIREEN